MADFRKWLTVLAVLAVMASVASAQVGIATAGGSASNALLCSATGAGNPQLRPEGYTELIGDILITCQGGPNQSPNTLIATTNITIYLFPGVPVTSRLFGASQFGNASEALLIIDESGANVATGVPGFGPQAPQSLCTTAQQQTTPSPCAAYVGTAAGTNTGGAAANYAVAVTAPNGATPAQNVYQGSVGDFGANTVTFYNVPVLPPATQGVNRVFRITNVRVPVPGGILTHTLTAVVSTSSNQTLPVSGTTINVAEVGLPTNYSAALVNNPFQQCNPQTRTQTATLTFTEGFATAFKTRVVPGGARNNNPGDAAGNTTYAAEATNTTASGVGQNNQNIPGGLYGIFGANTESGFIFPALSGTIGSGTYTAGLADFGTRLKAVFYNIPNGLTLYVSAVSQGGVAIPGGTSLSSYAMLVSTNVNDAKSDSPFTPITSAVNGSDGLPAVALSPIANSGAGPTNSAYAVWEVTNSNPSAQDAISVSVYISYVAGGATATNPYGTPVTDSPYGPSTDVQMTLAPDPTGGSFSTANATAGAVPIPRFADIGPNNGLTDVGKFTTIGLCQTTLLYPFVTAVNLGANTGFDTGIAVANTSWDPWGTLHQQGSCKLYGYGVTVGATGNTAAQPVVPNCDLISNPLPGSNCFPVVPPGQVMSVMASATQLNLFQGYVIAVCNFQYAHGYAAVTDLGLRNLWSSYLALELNNAKLGTPRAGTAGIEALIH